MTVQNVSTKLWYLKRINLFKSMSREEMMQLAQKVVEKNFRKKETIYLPGEPGANVYLLKKGVVKISKITADGRELTLAFLKPGEIFGELEAVGETSRDTQAEAHSDVLICVLHRNDLMRLMQSKSELGIRLSKLIGFRRQVLENRLENLVFRSIPQRLVALFVELAEQFGEKQAEGVKIDVRLTHQDIANLIGASRVTVTEILNDFKDRNLIAMDGKWIMVKDPDQFKTLSS